MKRVQCGKCEKEYSAKKKERLQSESVCKGNKRVRWEEGGVMKMNF